MLRGIYQKKLKSFYIGEHIVILRSISQQDFNWFYLYTQIFFIQKPNICC